jgi:glycosyltransferase involved in cell wall biosynthesis
MANSSNLILITTSYPYGFDEPYIESEILLLSQCFKNIFIISTINEPVTLLPLPHNATAVRYEKKKNSWPEIFSSIGNRDFRKEILFIVKRFGLKVKPIHFRILADAWLTGKKFSEYILARIRLQQLNIEETAIYAYWMDYYALAPAILKSKGYKGSCITRTHGFDLYFERHKSNYLPFRRFICSQLNHVVFISEQGKKYAENILQLKDHSSIFRIGYLGVFENKMSRKQESDVFTVMSCSALIPLKRVHLIALALKNSGEKIKWVHFGSGAELTTVMEIAKQFPPNIQFDYKGFAPNTEVIDYLVNQRVDLFLNTSEYEGIPLSIIEALSFGVPCIGTDTGGMKEAIEHNKNGFLLPKDFHPEELTALIKQYMELSANAIELFRKEATLSWKNKFNAEVNYRKICALLKAQEE